MDLIVRVLDRNLTAFGLAIVVHGGIVLCLAWARPPRPHVVTVVEFEIREPPRPQPVITPPEPPKLEPERAERQEERPERPEPKIVKQQRQPKPTPPVFGIKPSAPAPAGPTSVPIGDTTMAQPTPRPGAPGGTPGGVPDGRDLPTIGPSYGADYLHNAPPQYPAVARRLRLQGTTTVRVLVGTDGRPKNVRLQHSSGVQVLDEAALEAVQHWTFVPARQGNNPLAAEVDVPVRFRLEEMTPE